MDRKKTVIIGAGPGGLTAAMLLASHGYEVDVFERKEQIGGRTGRIVDQGYTFDIGPTFLMMNFILEEAFRRCGRTMDDYVERMAMEPMYRLVFRGREILRLYRQDQEKMRQELDRMDPSGYASYRRFMTQEEGKFNKILPSLRIPYNSPFDMLKPELLRALPRLDMHTSLFNRLAKYYPNDDLRMAFTFQAKYLGMSPWNCPATFSIIPFIEHKWGIWHVRGGLNQICHGMAKVVREEGGRIHLNTEVDELLVEDDRAVGVRLADGETVHADDVVINADFAQAMTKQVAKPHRSKYTDEKLAKMKYSCSTFMLYLGVSGRFDLDHHNIFFADDYKLNVQQISDDLVLSEDPSIYVQNAVVTDASVAPAGKSALYILVPVPNNSSQIDWGIEGPRFRRLVLDSLKRKAGLEGLEERIEVEHMITPTEWEQQYEIYRGATFNLGHNVGQMLYFRPHNQFEEFSNCYLAGGGTHPGSGLPTIVESALISTKMMFVRDGVSLKASADAETKTVAVN